MIEAIVAGAAIVVGLIVAFLRGQANANKEHKEKERDAYEAHLRDIERAASARPSGGVSDDPYNRD